MDTKSLIEEFSAKHTCTEAQKQMLAVRCVVPQKTDGKKKDNTFAITAYQRFVDPAVKRDAVHGITIENNKGTYNQTHLVKEKMLTDDGRFIGDGIIGMFNGEFEYIDKVDPNLYKEDVNMEGLKIILKNNPVQHTLLDMKKIKTIMQDNFGEHLKVTTLKQMIEDNHLLCATITEGVVWHTKDDDSVSSERKEHIEEQWFELNVKEIDEWDTRGTFSFMKELQTVELPHSTATATEEKVTIPLIPDILCHPEQYEQALTQIIISKNPIAKPTFNFT